jgi:hypothetical protein
MKLLVPSSVVPQETATGKPVFVRGSTKHSLAENERTMVNRSISGNEKCEVFPSQYLVLFFPSRFDFYRENISFWFVENFQPAFRCLCVLCSHPVFSLHLLPFLVCTLCDLSLSLARHFFLVVLLPPYRRIVLLFVFLFSRRRMATDAYGFRFYEPVFPKEDELVVVRVEKRTDVGAFVSLLEYGKLEGMILMTELSRKRIRSVKKLISVGKTEIVHVRTDSYIYIHTCTWL